MAVIVEELDDVDSDAEEQGVEQGPGVGEGEQRGAEEAGQGSAAQEAEEEGSGEAGTSAAASREGEGGDGPVSGAGTLEDAEGLKAEGNAAYKAGKWEEAEALYTRALEVCPEGEEARAVFHANRAAVHLSTEDFEACIEDCSQALAIDEKYIKALLRRSTAYEKKDDFDKALQDAQAVVEADAGNRQGKEIVARLEPVVAKRLEEQKDEMIGQLKDLGNTVLGKFGLSLDNFKATQDPNTGSYSINFQQ